RREREDQVPAEHGARIHGREQATPGRVGGADQLELHPFDAQHVALFAGHAHVVTAVGAIAAANSSTVRGSGSIPSRLPSIVTCGGTRRARRSSSSSANRSRGGQSATISPRSSPITRVAHSATRCI